MERLPDGTPVYEKGETIAWGHGLRAGIIFGLLGGIGLGGTVVGLVWWFFG